VPRKESPTLAVLREIREELKGTNARLEGTNTRLEGTNTRLDRVESRVGAVEKRQTEMEVRLATEIVAVGRAVGEVRDLLRDGLAVRTQVDDHERRLSALEKRGA
jgi:predicted  nucleic acid-binding Zn-ribbon protein